MAASTGGLFAFFTANIMFKRLDLAMVLSDDKEINPEDIQFQLDDPMNNLSLTEMTLKEYDFKILKFFLNKYDENVLKVATVLGIGKSTIYRMLKEEQSPAEFN